MRWITFLFLFVALQAGASDSTRLYNPRADAAKDVAQLLVKAKNGKKHVLLQIGGNWCVQCYRLNAYVQTDSTLKKLLYDNYVMYHLNYSPENKNEAYLAKLGYPQRFGFPVLVVLDANGNRLHTQDGALLQKGNGYDSEKIKGFLKSWSPAALDPLLYKE
jgi:thioredoxin-related protein